jgi:hypothetical protein
MKSEFAVNFLDFKVAETAQVEPFGCESFHDDK